MSDFVPSPRSEVAPARLAFLSARLSSLVTRVFKFILKWKRAAPNGTAAQHEISLVQPTFRLRHVTSSHASLLTADEVMAMNTAGVVAYAGDIRAELLDITNPSAIRVCLHDVAESVVLQNYRHMDIVKITTC